MLIIYLLVLVLTSLDGVQAWSLQSTNDSCYADRGSLVPCSDTITGNLLLMLFYGSILGAAAKLISDGAELLLDLGFAPSIIGGVVLPVLGAVPDGAIIIASGLGKDAQKKLSVGMGTLAGSTVMLLTIAWSASLVFAKCDLNADGISRDGTGKGKISLINQGISPLPEIRSNIIIMLATSSFYLIVQSADWHWGAKKRGEQPSYVKDAAIATLIICCLGLIAYIVYSIFDSKRNDRIARLHRDEIMKRKVLHHMLLFADRQTFKTPSPVQDKEDNLHQDREQTVSRKYFKAWHMKTGTRKAQEKLGNSANDEQSVSESTSLIVKEDVETDDSNEEDSKTKIACKSVAMLVVGVGLVTVFSDPMCDVLTALTDENNKSYIPIAPFYVSFIVTPFCSNASELVSSLIFASKKTRESATMTFSQLFGAATMNNTMCLAIFMALVVIKDLEWVYGAEVVSIIVVEWLVGIASLTKTYKLWMGLPIGLIYVFCLALVYLLEYELKWQ